MRLKPMKGVDAMPRFNYSHMREFFYSWHGGMHSPLYAAASSGLVSSQDELIAEIKGNLQWCEANPRAQRDCAKDARYMRRLIDALPAILGPIGKHSQDGHIYRGLPWADKTQLDFMVSAE